MKNIILVYIQIIYSISLILTSSSTSHISITIALAILTAIFLLGGEIDDRDIFCGKNTVHHFSKQIISSSSHGLVLAGETYDANSISKKSSSSKNQCEHSQGPKPDEIVSKLQVIFIFLGFFSVITIYKILILDRAEGVRHFVL